MQSPTPLADHIQDFLDYCEVEKGLSGNTQRNYQQYLRVFVLWLENNNERNLLPHQLTTDHIWKYRLYLARRHKTPAGRYLGKKSQNYYLIALRAFLSYFAEREIEALPPSRVTLAKQTEDNTITFLDAREVEEMMKIPDTSTANGLRDRAIMELLFSSGMRISELIALDEEQIPFRKDDDENTTYELSIAGKGGRVRTIFISPRAAYWIQRYLTARNDAFKPLFINFRTKDPERVRLSVRYVQMMISRCARLAGIAKKVTPHTIRHTYATDLLSHGADLRSVQELLGHKNVSTTQVYTHVTNKQLRDIHRKYHGGNEFGDQ